MCSESETFATPLARAWITLLGEIIFFSVLGLLAQRLEGPMLSAAESNASKRTTAIGFFGMPKLRENECKSETPTVSEPELC